MFMCVVMMQFCRSSSDAARVQSVLGELFVAQLRSSCHWCSCALHCCHGQRKVPWKSPGLGGLL